MSKIFTGVGAKASARMLAKNQIAVLACLRHSAKVVCRDKHGRVKWVEEASNLIMTAGLNDIGNKYYGGSAYTAAHYMGLKGAGTPLAADTAASIANWAEITAYDEATREVLTLASFSAGAADNSGNECVFTMNDTATVAGVGYWTNSTKGGSTGVLVWAVDFSASRNVVASDTLTVTVTGTFTSV